MSKQLDRLQVNEPLRREALTRCGSIVQRWEIALPRVEPLVLDFGLQQFERVGLIEYWIANEIRAGYCAKYLFVFDGQECPAHSHAQKHETFFVVKGAVRLALDGNKQEFDAGSMLAVPPDHVHSFAGNGDALLLEISTPCIVADNRFEHPAIRRWFQHALSQ
jgi:mannose-6-phosphate isomerase-like protein (cupin superfamily)